MSTSWLLRTLAAAALAVAPLGGAAAETLSRAQLDALGPEAVPGRGVTPSASTVHAVCFGDGAAPAVRTERSPAVPDVSLSVRSSAEVADDRAALDEPTRELLAAHRRAGGADDAVPRLLVATFTVRSRGGSLPDDTAVAERALALIRAGDVTGFYRSCGTHYVRNLARDARHVVAIGYDAVDAERDAAFEAALRGALVRFGAGERPTAEPEEAHRLALEALERRLHVTVRRPGAPVPSTALVPDAASLEAGLALVLADLIRTAPSRVADAEIVAWNLHPGIQAALDAPFEASPAPPAVAAAAPMVGSAMTEVPGASQAVAPLTAAAAAPIALVASVDRGEPAAAVGASSGPGSSKRWHPVRLGALAGGGTSGLALDVRGELVRRQHPVGLGVHGAYFPERREVAIGVVPTWSLHRDGRRLHGGIGLGVVLVGPDGAGTTGVIEAGGELPLGSIFSVVGLGRFVVGPDFAGFTLSAGASISL